MMGRWFADLKIANKLTLGFGLVLLLMSSILLTDVLLSTQQTRVTDRLVYQLYPARQDAFQIETLVRGTDDYGAWYLMSQNQKQARSSLRAYYQEVDQLQAMISKAQAEADTPEQHAAIHELFAYYFGVGGYYNGNEALFTFRRSGNANSAFEGYVNSPLLPGLNAANTYLTVTQREIVQEKARESAAATTVLFLSSMFGLLALLSGIGIAILIARSIVRPLAEVRSAAQNVSNICVASLARGLTALSQGNLSVPARIGSTPPTYKSRDEIGQTAQAVRTIITDIHQTISAYGVAQLELQRLYAEIEEKNQILIHTNVQLQSLATSDSLTGLANHRVVMNQINEELTRCQSTRRECAILFVDVDHFKKVNDTWGHRAGDMLLCSIAHRLASHLRPEDFIGRYGGEEFAIILSDVDQLMARQIAERLREAIAEQPYNWELEDEHKTIALTATISIGIAIYPLDGATREDLIQAADKAMYQAKNTGRNRVYSAGEDDLYTGELLAPVAEKSHADDGIVQALSIVASIHDEDTSDHAQRMVELATITARALGQSQEKIQLVRVAALLHDIGKIGISDAILHKPGPLTAMEWAVMRQHPGISQQILEQVGGNVELAAPIVVAHHERWDGRGYPYGLVQEAIPLEARILSVVDSYDAMTSHRPYREPVSSSDACEELRRCAGGQYDPSIVDAFIQALTTYGNVELSMQRERNAKEMIVAGS